MKITLWRALIMLATLTAPATGVMAQDFPGREKLRAQSNEVRRDIIQVTDSVYVAVGYSASNVILIQGDAGSIIVDSATDMVAARNVSLVCHAMCVSTVRGASSIESVMETGRGSRKSIAARAKRPVI